MILIGLGANIAFDKTGQLRATCGAALDRIARSGAQISRRSQWYESAPVPVSSQPWFVNGVAVLETGLSAADLIDHLLQVEAAFGRRRDRKNAPRTIDLDLIAYGDEVIDGTTARGNRVQVPHPRMFERAFVLLPLRDVAPDWRHPVLHAAVDELIATLPENQDTRPMEDADGLYGTEWFPPS